MVLIQPVVTEVPAAATPTPTPEPTEVPVKFSDYCPTVNMSYEELVGSTDDMKAKTQDLVGDGFPASDKYYIIVDKYWQVVMVYMRKDNANEPDYDRPVRYMICSTGKVGTDSVPDRPAEGALLSVRQSGSSPVSDMHSQQDLFPLGPLQEKGRARDADPRFL